MGLLVMGILGTQFLEADGQTIIYFTRHGEDMSPEDAVDLTPWELICWGAIDAPLCLAPDEICWNPEDPCCLEILSDEGHMRAQALADWFSAQGLTEQLTHVLATHKIRTRQTIGQIAADALATSVFVMGPGEGMKLVEGLPDTEAVIVYETGEGTAIKESKGVLGKYEFTY